MDVVSVVDKENDLPELLPGDFGHCNDAEVLVVSSLNQCQEEIINLNGGGGGVGINSSSSLKYSSQYSLNTVYYTVVI